MLFRIKETKVVAVELRAEIHSHKNREYQTEDENTRVQEATENSSIARAIHCLITVKFQMTALKVREGRRHQCLKKKI